MKLFFHVTKTSRKKIKYFWEQEGLLRWTKKHFSSFLKDVQLPEKLPQALECGFKEISSLPLKILNA